MYSWTGEEQPAPQKRQCHSCGRHEHLDKLSLCDTCRTDWDEEMSTLDQQDGLEVPLSNLTQGHTKP